MNVSGDIFFIRNKTYYYCVICILDNYMFR